MAIIKQLDKRSGITYVYDSKSYRDPETKKVRSNRTLIGKLDPETGDIIPTDGRGRKRSPNYIPEPGEYQMPSTIKALKSEVLRLLEENAVLKDKITKLQSKAKG
jgi:hypothetical protein